MSPPGLSAAALAEHLSARLIGPDRIITHIASLTSATDTALAALFEPRFVTQAKTCQAGVIITSDALRHHCPSTASLLVVESPRASWGKTLRRFYPKPVQPPPPVGVHAFAAVDPAAELAPGVRIGPFACVEAGACVGADAVLFAGAFVGAGARIGASCVLHPHAVIHAGSVLGDDVFVGAHATIGSPGFGLDALGRVPHIGSVHIGDRVSIGAQTCIDRGTVDATIIEADAHLDNLVQVGHNAFVGRGAVLCGQVGLAGGARVEAGAVLGGQAGVAGNATVPQRARVAAQAGVTRNLRGEGPFSGHPAEPNRGRLKRIARLRKLAKERGDLDDR